MGLNIAKKIITEHLVEGEMEAGEEIAINIDRTLTQDATGTMAYLQFESLGVKRVRTELSVSYVDHNTLQAGFENADDHRFLQSFASKYGIFFSKPGNGVCHQVNLERFSIPGRTIVGSDSHTPTAGGAGMLAIGVGGLDVAIAMSGSPLYLKMPKIVGVELTGSLKPWVAAKDVILELLRRYTVKGGVGKVFEYYGEGVKTLSVPERATITNMGAELGATTSLFPSDNITRKFFKQQNRISDWSELQADSDADYDETIHIELDLLEPLIAAPSSPDNVKKVADVAGTSVQQVIIGSCTNSSYKDLMVAAHVLKRHKIHPDLSLHITPGSKQVIETIVRDGGFAEMVGAGARIGESCCDGCIGMGSAPATDTVSVRSFNRNWKGRSGTPDDRVYLASVETCIAAAVRGELTDPRELGTYPEIPLPKRFVINDSMIIPPNKQPETVKIIRGPNIKPLPEKQPLSEEVRGEVLIKLADNISTDAIIPAGAKILPLRSNIPAISEYVFHQVDPLFSKRAREKNGGYIVGGENYGQGSSREHAALAPMYLGVSAIIAKSFARIHQANLINFGILPLEFENSEDYTMIKEGTEIVVPGIIEQLKENTNKIKAVIDNSKTITLVHNYSPRQKKILLSGGLLNYTKTNG
ncbi:MAG: 3-isopropylmalate dehydratase large subunit [Candidatus Argoarchaeum ethanivorans]|uniref:3-isopropylmalate dehydratase large subunit n=1 Tax=Candidatus Argoarchaeum ethanivorans TaxID=2608793 RepID=A0A811T4Q2_9EURY|nr:MAG: 3-isopropylmalate dehydratase large subunit [Candidatus Argoarchaeum ethanivorans]